MAGTVDVVSTSGVSAGWRVVWGRPAAGPCSVSTLAASQPGQHSPQAGGPSSLVSLLRSPSISLRLTQSGLPGPPHGASATCGELEKLATWGVCLRPQDELATWGVCLAFSGSGVFLSFCFLVCFLCHTHLRSLVFSWTRGGTDEQVLGTRSAWTVLIHTQGTAVSPACELSPRGQCSLYLRGQCSLRSFLRVPCADCAVTTCSSLMRKRSLVLTIKTRLKVYT